MKITKNNYWYTAVYRMCGRICIGYGTTHLRAIKDCLKDMKLTASL